MLSSTSSQADIAAPFFDLPELTALVEHLSAARIDSETWNEWEIRAVHGGWNNRVFRVTGQQGKLAIKFTMRDQRRRAWREYQALLAITQAGFDLAPRPIFIDEKRWPHPVIVMTWLEGIPFLKAPQSESEWEDLVGYFCHLKTVRPNSVQTRLIKGVIDARSAYQAVELAMEQAAYIHPGERSVELNALMGEIQKHPFARWPLPRPSLCRVDPNPRNFIFRSNGLASVDWENAGWGDPAFDFAGLVTHPEYLETPPERLDWAVRRYSSQVDDPDIQRRILTYRTILLAWWAARTARYLYEMPRGLDTRLISLPDNWETNMQDKHARYLNLAFQNLHPSAT